MRRHEEVKERTNAFMAVVMEDTEGNYSDPS